MKDWLILLAFYLSFESAVFWAKNNELMATLCAGTSLAIVITIISMAITRHWKRKNDKPPLGILRKFRRRSAIQNEEELKVLRRYASTGMVAFSFNAAKRQPEAELTDQGKWFVGAADWSR